DYRALTAGACPPRAARLRSCRGGADFVSSERGRAAIQRWKPASYASVLELWASPLLPRTARPFGNVRLQWEVCGCSSPPRYVSPLLGDSTGCSARGLWLPGLPRYCRATPYFARRAPGRRAGPDNCRL